MLPTSVRTEKPKAVGHLTLSRGTTALFALLLIATGYGVGLGIGSYFRPSQNSPLAPSGTGAKQPPPLTGESGISDLEHRYELLKVRLDDAVESSKHIDRLITILLTITTLYAFALGLNSYFGLKQILDTAKEDSKRILDGIQALYPELAGLHASLINLLARVNNLFPIGRSWTDAYPSNPREREEVIIAEMRLAGLEVFRLGALSSNLPSVSKIFQGLGRFYSSRFVHELRAEDTVDSVDRSDWHRASLYFEKAMEVGPPSSILWTDFGTHKEHLDRIDDRAQERAGAKTLSPAQLKEIDDLRKQAECLFRQSLDLDPENPGALDGLGWIYYKRQNYKEAIKYYSRITSIEHWGPGERDMNVQSALWNRANCRALIWKGDGPQAEKIFQDLRESKAIATARDLDILNSWRRDIVKYSVGPNLSGKPEDTPFASLFQQYREQAAELLE